MSIYYITPIIGTGAKSNPFRTKVSQYGVSQVTVIPTSSTTGLPLFTWALVAVPDAANTAAIDADATIDRLPIANLDATLGSLTNQQRQTFQQLGTKYSVPTVAGLTNQSTCRDALVAFGRALDPNFDPNQFNVI
jgi:hypothetical protein